MKRRSSFKSILLSVVTITAFTCREIYGAVSRWSWPGYPGPSQLREHLINSPNHPTINAYTVAGKSFSELIRLHDYDHQRQGYKPRWSTPRHVPGTSTGAEPVAKKTPQKNVGGWREIPANPPRRQTSSSSKRRPFRLFPRFTRRR